MPFKIGLAEKRKRLVEQELKRIITEIAALDVEKVILFGSLSTDNINKASDIDLIIIKNTNERFLDRLEGIYQHLLPRVGVDILVYTPQEFEEMKDKNQFIISVLKHARVIYEKK